MGKAVTDGNGTTTTFDVKGGKGEAMLFVPVAVHIDQVPLMVFFHGHSDNDKQQHNSLAEYIDYMSVRDLPPRRPALPL
jgi:poly(3-hydroxybutyrate) depolymerase